MSITIIVRNEGNWDAKKLSRSQGSKRRHSRAGASEPRAPPHLTLFLLLRNVPPVMFLVTKWTFLSKIRCLSIAFRFIKTKTKPWTQYREFSYTSHSVSPITSHRNMVYLAHLMNWYCYIMKPILYSDFRSLLFLKPNVPFFPLRITGYVQSSGPLSLLCIASLFLSSLLFHELDAFEEWVCAHSLSCVQLLVTPCTAAYPAPLSVGFPRQEH